MRVSVSSVTQTRRRKALWKLTELWKNQRTVFPQLLEPSVHSFHNAGCYWNFKHNISCTPTALAFVLIIGRAERFQCGKQIAAYLGLVPLEDSSGNRRRLGHITKPGSSILRFLLVEAAQVTARSIPEWRNKYVHLTMRRGRKIAKVAMARRLAIALYWMWRKGWDYEQLRKFGSHAGQPENRDGVK
jgi:Transposase IS116/IS110/IS902 family